MKYLYISTAVTTIASLKYFEVKSDRLNVFENYAQKWITN
jgi:hypothetical protein